jgi:hypothetical protein
MADPSQKIKHPPNGHRDGFGRLVFADTAEKNKHAPNGCRDRFGRLILRLENSICGLVTQIDFVITKF